MSARPFLPALILAATLAAAALPALAENGIPWNNLSPDEQAVLHKHRGEWATLPRNRQLRLLTGARKYLALPQDKRDAVRQKREQYERMSPDRRRRLREEYREQRRHR